ncbi:MAG: tetratricopeptide repeat protein [Lentisphaeraceae bacterium]|nr:tetratricopeptide repeat protein [Lentisphaeraceae bacterium]
MNSKNISILFITVLVTITATNLLLVYNTKHADFTPPPLDFESNQKIYNDAISKAQKAASLGDHENAYLHYKDALKYYPGNQGILNKMGILKLKLKAFKDAEKIYFDLAEKSPDQPAYKVSLAFALLYQKKFNEAYLAIQEAKRLLSKDGRIHLISAAINAHHEKADAAVADLKNYPIQKAVSSFTRQDFFDKIRSNENFKEYEKSLEVFQPQEAELTE